MPPDPDAADPDIVGRIPLTAKTVLEVGCGTGVLAEEYKRRNPACRYFGIEIDPVSARVAATRMDSVANVDVELDPLPFGPEMFDCIVYGGVLADLRDPWAVLRQHAQALSATGIIVASVLNLDHWSFAERLLRGTWNYEDHGLFSRSHLRWFTLEMTRQALLGAGLHPTDVTPYIPEPAEAEDFARAMEPALAALGIDAPAYIRRAAPLSYVWRASRRPIAPIQVLSTMLAPVGGVSHVRIVEPLRAISTDPAVTTRIVTEFDEQQLRGAEPRIFVFHRPLLAGDAGLEPVRKLLDAGCVVVCEFDDNPDYIPVLKRPDIQNFRAVHAIQTTTEPLAAVLRRENPEVMVFPNGVSRLEEVRNYADPARMTVFFGGLNRGKDWPPLVPALNAVAAMAGERLQFHIVNDRGLFEALATPHKRFTPLCDYETYRNLLAGSEISFMPLADGPFNRCKSDLKYLEAAACGVTALASTVVYGDTIQDGRTGVLFRDGRELQQRLLRLIANPDAAKAIGQAGRSFVAGNRMLAYQVDSRIAWYRSLWARRKELHEALLARVPELAR